MNLVILVLTCGLNFVGLNQALEQESLLEIINEWMGEFNVVEGGDFKTFVENNLIPQDFDRPNKKAPKVISHIDYEDFKFNEMDLEEESSVGYPVGSGVLVRKDEVSLGQMNGKNRKRSVYSIVGNFTDKGFLNGTAEINYMDGSTIFGSVVNSVLHGLSYEVDDNSKIRFMGRYYNGFKKGRAWYFEPEIYPGAITGILDDNEQFNGQSFHYVFLNGIQSDLIHAESTDNGEMKNGKRHRLIGHKLEGGILVLNSKLDPDQEKNRNADLHFTTFGSGFDFEEAIMLQNVWYNLTMRPERTTIFLREFQNISELYEKDPSVHDKIKDFGLLDQAEMLIDSACNKIIASHQLEQDSVRETALVSALGSGSKWIGTLLDFSTGLQSIIPAGASNLVQYWYY